MKFKVQGLPTPDPMHLVTGTVGQTIVEPSSTTTTHITISGASGANVGVGVNAASNGKRVPLGFSILAVLAYVYVSLSRVRVTTMIPTAMNPKETVLAVTALPANIDPWDPDGIKTTIMHTKTEGVLTVTKCHKAATTKATTNSACRTTPWKPTIKEFIMGRCLKAVYSLSAGVLVMVFYRVW
jgi:hypothetical protein